MFRLKISAVSDVGNFRDNNEDNFYLDNGVYNRESADHAAYAYETDTAEKRIFAVCDGMGGGAMGEQMSLTAVRMLDELHPMLMNKNTAAVLNKHADEANRAICEALKEAGADMGGTTSVILSLEDGRAGVYNLGDSRAYLMRRDAERGKIMLYPLTEDHTLAQRKIKMGIYTEDDPWAQREKHMLTKFLGVDKTYLGLNYQKNEPFSLHAGDVFLLCSDGVTDGCTARQILSVLHQYRGDAAAAVVQAALEAGSRDNTTAVVIEVLEDN